MNKNIVKRKSKGENFKIFNNYNDYELNHLSYQNALFIDKRTYIEYYFSLLRMNHFLIFSFYTYNDYNSKIIKICLFFFSVALYFTINALFFNKETMHKIYVDQGNFNFIYQLPKILYSSIISSSINNFISFLSLSERNILELKEKNKKNIKLKVNEIKKSLTIKFIIFFIFMFLFLILFWFYLSCFCSVYRNTQIHLMKDILISFAMSLVYQLILNLVPGIFRIPSLRTPKRNKKYLYRISQIIQSLI